MPLNLRCLTPRLTPEATLAAVLLMLGGAAMRNATAHQGVGRSALLRSPQVLARLPHPQAPPAPTAALPVLALQWRPPTVRLLMTTMTAGAWAMMPMMPMMTMMTLMTGGVLTLRLSWLAAALLGRAPPLQQRCPQRLPPSPQLVTLICRLETTATMTATMTGGGATATMTLLHRSSLLPKPVLSSSVHKGSQSDGGDDGGDGNDRDDSW